MIIFNALQTSLSGGLGRYCFELSKAIYELKEIEIKIVIRYEDREKFNFAEEEDLIIVKDIESSKNRNYYEQFVLPKEVEKKYGDAIIHYPDIMAPILSKNKVVITVHDMAFRSVKGAFTFKSTVWKNFIMHLSIKKADKVVVITDFTKSEVERYYPNYISKVGTIYNGFNNFANDNINLKNINKEILDLTSKKFLLTVSTISPRKNMDGLIKAFNKIKEKTDLNLVVAGKKGWLYEDVFRIVDELSIGDRVIFTYEVNDDELKYLYKNAYLLVYPSFYEGFGLPPLEAMSYGIPCVVSNSTSIPEVVGDAAILVDPYSIDDISSKILMLINDKEKTNQLKERGYLRLEKFSWEKCANETIKVYKNLGHI